MPDEKPARAGRIDFSPFTLDALPQMLVWLSDPDVRPWYDEGELTMENLARHYAPEDGMHRFLIVIDDRPVGYIQTYRVGNEPEYQRQIGVDPDAVATDLFIGDPGYRNRGWGSEVLRVFVDRIVFGQLGADVAMIAPDPANARAVRSYEKVGFRAIKTVYVVDEGSPGNTGDELVMLLHKDNR